jgi:RES domain-containing protein
LTRVYRILRRPYARRPIDGEGSYLFGGRWSSVGTRLAHTAAHQSLAIIEYFVHLDPVDAPHDLVMATMEIPDEVSRVRLPAKRLPANWRAVPAPPGTAALGDRFVREGRKAILIVPSAVVPAETNWLINPRHGDFEKIRVRAVEPFEYDSRFFR